MIHFQRANLTHQGLIFSWLEEPHMKEFWDNSQDHKDDILNFINGRKRHYFYGTTNYFIGSIDDKPFCFILSDILKPEQELTDLHRKNLSPKGNTITLDFGIGNKEFIGKGLAAKTLEAFVNFYHNQIDPLADTFFIDPDEDNPRALHVYEKAGFESVGNFDVSDGAFKGHVSDLMVKIL